MSVFPSVEVFLRKPVEMTVQIITIQGSTINTPDIGISMCIKSLKSVQAFSSFQFG